MASEIAEEKAARQRLQAELEALRAES